MSRGLGDVYKRQEYEYADEAKYVNVKVPQLNNTGNSELEKRVNREIAKMINQEVEASKKRAEEEYNAYILTGGDPKNFIPYDIVIDYEVKCLDEHYVSFVISENETRATGYYEMFYYNIDLDTGKDITLKELAEASGRSSASVRRMISDLLEKGCIEKVGVGKEMRYIVVK